MPDPDSLVLIVTGAAAVAMALAAVLQRNLIRAVVAFALSSIGLAALFYQLASPYAAVLELVVGSGLVSVLFLVSLILAGGEEEEAHA
jgi:NADH:ubiquinone oxidoreductase subunit 6 (subunit J)